jgi:hypothetical protein
MGIVLCPVCDGEVSTTRSTCSHCGNEIKDVIKCPECKRIVNITEQECPHCGFVFEKIDTPTPDTPSDSTDNCACNCHNNGLAGLLFRLINFFQKLFGMNKVCACGVAH